MVETNVPSEERSNVATDKDILEGFYFESPPVEEIIDTDGIKLVKVRSGQEMVYWRFGKVSETTKKAGLRLITGLLELYGSGMIVNVDQVRNEHVKVETVQTNDNIELKTATASLFYNIEDPIKTARAAFDDKKRILSYQDILRSRAEADLRQFVRSKKLDELNGLDNKQQDILNPDTKEYLMEHLGIKAHNLLYRRIDLPDDLERSLAQAVISLQEAKGRLELSRVEGEIARHYAAAGDSYKNNPDALTLRKLQTLDNLVESQGKHSLFLGMDPLMGSIFASRNQA
ncbi:MAG TPA: SPFH domain-containing protein [Candidatus Nanoarchaeia archaeon]|nr:SPFH domain-containing protein [Candidatus Nanoarchaeia archaeon]